MFLRDTEFFGKSKQRICDNCLRPQETLYNTRKLGLSKTFGSDICEQCLILRLREKRDSYMAKENMGPHG